MPLFDRIVIAVGVNNQKRTLFSVDERLDCIRSLTTPVVEVHISNVHAREEFRNHSMISAGCKGVIAGFGLDSYRLAVESIIEVRGKE